MAITRWIFFGLLASALSGGCTDYETPLLGPPPNRGDPFYIDASNYSTRNFFVDTLYRRYYEPYYTSTPPSITPSMQLTQITEAEVWVQRLGVYPDPNERTAVAILSLPSRASGGYDSTFRQMPEVLGERESGPFVRLSPASDYSIVASGYLGVIILRNPVPDEATIAISYRCADSTRYGDFALDSRGPGSILVLKMLKPRLLLSNGPSYSVAWNQLLKNTYDIGGNVSEGGFRLQVWYIAQGTPSTSIFGQTFLHILGVDAFDQNWRPLQDGDGQFDYLPGKTIDPVNGQIIFPWLRPFDDGIASFLRSQGREGLEGVFCAPEIYDTPPSYDWTIGRHMYRISGVASHN